MFGQGSGLKLDASVAYSGSGLGLRVKGFGLRVYPRDVDSTPKPVRRASKSQPSEACRSNSVWPGQNPVVVQKSQNEKA